MEITLPSVQYFSFEQAAFDAFKQNFGLNKIVKINMKYSLVDPNSLPNTFEFELSKIIAMTYFSKIDSDDPEQNEFDFTIEKPIRNEENIQLLIYLINSTIESIHFDDFTLDELYDFYYDFANFLITLGANSNINQIIINFLEMRNIEEEMTNLNHLLDLLYLKYKFNVDDNSEITYLANNFIEIQENSIYKAKMFINWSLNNLDVLKNLFSKLHTKLLNHDPLLNITIELLKKEIENPDNDSQNLKTINTIIDLFEYVNFSYCTPREMNSNEE